jgi:hypothetical protein
MKHYGYWVAAWVALNLVDAYLTWLILADGGYEINPIANIGLFFFILLKTFMMIAVSIALPLIKKYEWIQGLTMGLAVVVIYTGRWLLI